ncbi:MAG: uroporphyrinogen decarboxylase [Anaerolineae bacterium]|nr:uroporphyrinogen decarboxylase [Anaerolineae bacterium]
MRREMGKRERLEAAIAGAPVDRPPIALWRHWPVDDCTSKGLAESTVLFQETFDYDIAKVSPPSSFCIQDWGVRDEWRGNVEGTRDYTRRAIRRPEDWHALPVLDPRAGRLGDQLACLQLLKAAFGKRVPFIQTIFNPLSQAKNLVGPDKLLLDARRHPEALRAGLETITETTIRFIEAAKLTGIAGIFYAVQHAAYDLMSENEYRAFGRAYDLRVLAAAEGLWLNVLHLHGTSVMFDMVADYPVQVLNWHDRDSGVSLRDGQAAFAGAVCGGLSRWKTVVLGTPEVVREEAADAFAQTGGRRFILGTGCVAPVVSPVGNLLAARRAFD